MESRLIVARGFIHWKLEGFWTALEPLFHHSSCLSKASPDWLATLKSQGFLTRDAREKERRKYGRRGARASYQFSKR